MQSPKTYTPVVTAPVLAIQFKGLQNLKQVQHFISTIPGFSHFIELSDKDIKWTVMERMNHYVTAGRWLVIDKTGQLLIYTSEAFSTAFREEGEEIAD